MPSKKLNIDQSLLDACVHCGLCLPACPTYLATGRELESPRGRIYLLNLLQQGKEPFSERMAEHLDSCLGCLGCQTACPSGVNYETLINEARQPVNERKPFWQKFLQQIIFTYVLTNDQLLYFLGKCLRFWQKHKLDEYSEQLSKTIGLNKIGVIKNLLGWQSLLPFVPEHKQLPNLISNSGKNLPVVQLFKACIMDIFYNPVNLATLKLLNELSGIVAVPKQTCCGALALHSGQKHIARQLAKQNIDNFAANEGAVVVTASGCTAMLKTYPELFDEIDPWHDRAMSFSKRVKDMSEFLAHSELPNDLFTKVDENYEVTTPLRLAYHAACHLSHAQGIHQEPKQLLEKFAESINDQYGQEIIKLIPLTEEEHCCGSAGIYNLMHPDLSNIILSRKIAMIKETGANIIVTTNPGCLLQIEAGLRKEGLAIKVVHLAEVLAGLKIIS